MLGSLVLWAFVGAVVIVQGYVTGEGHSPVFWMALVMTPMLVYSSLVETVLRVTEQSRMVMFTRVAWRWLQLALMLGAVMAVQHTASAAYGGKLLAVVVGMAFYFGWARRNLHFARRTMDPAEIRQSFSYGMPLVATEIMAVALVSVDRIMLKNLSGDFAVVGIYSVGAALAMQVHMFMNLTVFESFTPAANRVFTTDGAAAVRALKRTMLMPMTYAAIGVAMLLWTLGTDLIIALSGAGKSQSGPVFELMGAMNAVLPVMLVCGFGLVLERRTKTVLALMCLAVAVNAALNWWWIPAYGVMGALVERGRTGVGRTVEVSMLEAMCHFNLDAFTHFFQAGEVMGPYSRPSVSQSYVLRCADDQWIALHMSSPEKFWRGLAQAIERPQLLDDARFATREARIEHQETLIELLGERFATRARADWCERLAREDVPHAPMYDTSEALNDPQAQHLELTASAVHPQMGLFRTVRSPVSFDGERSLVVRPPPTLGEHNEEIRAELRKPTRRHEP